MLVEQAIAGLTAGNDGPTALGDPTQFSASVSAGSNIIYEWDFGDGQDGSGASPSHTYAADGSYTAVVTATNALGSASASTEVLVEEAITGLKIRHRYMVTVGDPEVFSATVESGSNMVFEWDFGDGQTGSGTSPTHTYLASGHYTIVVTATNALGQQSVTSQIIVATIIYQIYMPVVARP